MSTSPSFLWLLLLFGVLIAPPAFFVGYIAAKRRVSLRFLLFVVTVECVALATFAWMFQRQTAQRLSPYQEWLRTERPFEVLHRDQRHAPGSDSSP